MMNLMIHYSSSWATRPREDEKYMITKLNVDHQEMFPSKIMAVE